jgi:MoaA/NifB/PqqE/SkfB family radical SAM enzyme
MKIVLRGSTKYLELDGGLKNLEYLMLNLPHACNYKCLKCCNFGRASEGHPLSRTEIFGLIDEAKSVGGRVLVIAGEGEPLLDKKIRSIVAKADNAGLIPYIFTNGSLLNERTTRFFRDHNTSLVINLDSLSRHTYERLSGVKGSFATIMSNLDDVRKIFSNTYSKIEGYNVRRIAINTVVSSHNVLEAKRMQEFCGDDFVLVYNTPMSIGKASADLSFKTNKEMEEKIKQLSGKTIPLGTSFDGNWCAYMRNGISVGASGEILACAYSLESASKFGNIRSDGLRKHVGKANLAVDDFYRKKGHSRCILRHQAYSSFLKD